MNQTKAGTYSITLHAYDTQYNGGQGQAGTTRTVTVGLQVTKSFIDAGSGATGYHHSWRRMGCF